MTWDRPRSARVADAVAEAVGVSLLFDGEPARAARLMEVSPGVLVVSHEGPPVDSLAGAEIVFEEDLLRVKEVLVLGNEVHDGRSQVSIEVVDSLSRAKLWQLLDRARVGAQKPLPGHIESGRIPGRGHYSETARLERLRWARATSTAPLGTLDRVGLDVSTLSGNTENVVGTVEVPVGLAGPLLIHGDHIRGWVTAPLATTEGALVASVTRGATAMSRSGGVRVRVLGQTMSRAPVFKFDDVHTAARFGRWAEDHAAEIAYQASQVSRHAQLSQIWPIQFGRAVHLRMSYETADAAGQNMTTACTWHACKWIVEAISEVPGLQLGDFYVEGNASGDKKANYLSMIAGRGTKVTAECLVDRLTVEQVLKTTPQRLAASWRYTTQTSFQAGMIGNSVNIANLIAAIFTATGQDIGCVHESSIGVETVEEVEEGIYASILIPTLILGTVGGGTDLPNQRDYLDLMGCAGPDRGARLAEIVAGFALALDLSTGAAVSGGQFADAHERLGRNRPVAWLTRSDLSPDFFTPMLSTSLGDDSLHVTDVMELPKVRGDSIITYLTSQAVKDKLLGLQRLRLSYAGTTEGHVDVVAKFKPLDEEVIITSNKVASLCGGRLAEVYPTWRDWTGAKDTHTRELGIYRDAGPEFREIMPRLYGLYENVDREAYVLLLEDLTSILPAATADWSSSDVDAALRGIASAHAVWLGREDDLCRQPWLGRWVGASQMAAMKDLWLALLEHNALEYPDWLDEFTLVRLEKAVHLVGRWWQELEAMPRTLVHNDFNPRNIALRPEDKQLVAYDWELATIHVPQRDLAELLVFCAGPEVTADRVDHHLEVHRRALESAAGVTLDEEQWRRGYKLALRDFTITRLQLYLMGHTQRQYDFLGPAVQTLKRLMRIEGEHDLAREQSE
jgi:NADP-dependent 3-hydroxy-3-methylglutaryl-CoA reductase